MDMTLNSKLLAAYRLWLLDRIQAAAEHAEQTKPGSSPAQGSQSHQETHSPTHALKHQLHGRPYKRCTS